MVSLILLITHVLFFIVTLEYFTPFFNTKQDPNYQELFTSNFPKFSIISIVIPIIIVVYAVLFIYLFPTTYIDSFDKISIYICLVIFTSITLILFLKLVNPELKNADYRINQYKSLLIPSIYVFIYTSSVLLSMTFIAFTNQVFDFSKGEEHIGVIEHAQLKSDGIQQEHNIDIKPDIYGIKNIKVSSTIIDKIKIRSKAKRTSDNSSLMTEEVKIKVYVYKGLFGIRYIGKTMDVLK